MLLYLSIRGTWGTMNVGQNVTWIFYVIQGGHIVVYKKEDTAGRMATWGRFFFLSM